MTHPPTLSKGSPPFSRGSHHGNYSLCPVKTVASPTNHSADCQPKLMLTFWSRPANFSIDINPWRRLCRVNVYSLQVRVITDCVYRLAVNWLDHSRTFREQGVEESETLLLRRKFFYSDQNVDSRDPVQLNLLYVQVNARTFHAGWR